VSPVQIGAASNCPYPCQAYAPKTPTMYMSAVVQVLDAGQLGLPIVSSLPQFDRSERNPRFGVLRCAGPCFAFPGSILIVAFRDAVEGSSARPVLRKRSP
jgi:hypothetical protein